jgi:Flp pilus assembly protein TadB
VTGSGAATAACAVLAVVAAALAAALAVPHGGPRRPVSGRLGSPADRSPMASPMGTPMGTPMGSPTGSPVAPHGDPPVLRVSATVAAVLGALLLLGGVPGAVVCVPAGALSWWLTGRMEPPAVRRRRERLAGAVPQVVDLMAACLSAGLSPAAALELVTTAVDDPAREELAAVSARLRVGVDPPTVWRDLADHPQLGGLGRALSRAVDSGASVADALARLAGDLRRQGRADAESRARAVGVRAAVPLGVCLLPAFVLVGVVPLVAGSVSVLLRH